MSTGSKNSRVKKNLKSVSDLLGFEDVKRMAKAADPSIKLKHTSMKKTASTQVVKSRIPEFKLPNGKFPDAFFLKAEFRQNPENEYEEVTEDWAKEHPGAWEKRLEPVFKREEHLVKPVQEELYDFLRRFMGHVISETSGRNGNNDVTTVVVTREQVVAALNDIKFNFGSFYNNTRHRSKTRRAGGTLAGAINMVAFRRMLDHAVEMAISDRRIMFPVDPEKKKKKLVTYGTQAVDLIKETAEMRISSIFFAAAAYAGKRHQVSQQHFNIARRDAPITWDVMR